MLGGGGRSLSAVGGEATGELGGEPFVEVGEGSRSSECDDSSRRRSATSKAVPDIYVFCVYRESWEEKRRLGPGEQNSKQTAAHAMGAMYMTMTMMRRVSSPNVKSRGVSPAAPC